MNPQNLAKLILAFFKALLGVLQSVRIKTSAPLPQPLPRPRNDSLPSEVVIPIPEPPATLPQKTGFLICPIKRNDPSGKPLTSRTAQIISVIDHSGTKIDPGSGLAWGITAKDKKVRAFNGEIGDGESSSGAPYGYAKSPPGPFFSNKEINYVGSGSGPSGYPDTHYLNYDGHAGYDFRCGLLTEIQAPADGEVFKAQADPIDGVNKTWALKNLGLNSPTAWEGWHTFYIKHPNGYSTWFLHCTKFVDEIASQLTDYQKSVSVKQGQLIAFSGKHGGVGPHLHFEVRDAKGAIVDPYQDQLWQDY